MQDGTWSALDRCAIAGIGWTEFSRNCGRSEAAMAAEACSAALAEAGLTASDVDGVVRCDMDNVTHNVLAETLGIPNLTYWGVSGPGGSAPSAQIAQAVGAIMSGQAEVVLCHRSLNWSSGGFGGGGAGGMGMLFHGAGGRGTYEEFFIPYGHVMPVQTYAMMARRHMIEFGTTQEQFGRIAVTCREHANANPNAQMHGRPMDMDSYMESRMISSPLRLFDCCLVSDGACAVVVTSADRAADLATSPVLIRSVAMGTGPGVQGGMLSPTLMRPDPLTWSSKYVADTLWPRAGLGPEDIDVAQIYDCFTPTVLFQLEDYGFCKQGEGGPFVDNGEITMEGSLPINTGGGNLSEGYIHGMNHVVEAVRQLRGESTSQVPGAEVCLVTSGPPLATSAMILRKGD